VAGLYGHKWQQMTKAWLQSYPMCVMCLACGQIRAGAVVDHITPHKGDVSLFWDQDNWQTLCHHCHDTDKQRHERANKSAGDWYATLARTIAMHRAGDTWTSMQGVLPVHVQRGVGRGCAFQRT